MTERLGIGVARVRCAPDGTLDLDVAGEPRVVHGGDGRVSGEDARHHAGAGLVERLLRTVALRVVRLFRKQGELDNLTYDGVLDALSAQATQRRLPLNEEEPSPPKRRCAFLEGFSQGGLAAEPSLPT